VVARALGILLVVALGLVEGPNGSDLGGDRAVEGLLLGLLGCARGGGLLGVESKHDAPVTIADVRALPIALGRIVDLPEDVQQLLVRETRGVVLDEHRLGVTGRVRAHFFVARVRRVPARIAHRRRHDPRHVPERVFRTPEAAPGEGRELVVTGRRQRGSAAYVPGIGPDVRHSWLRRRL